MLTAEVQAALTQRSELTVVKVADGTKDNWSYLEALVPEGEARVDFYHAVEQIKTALDVCGSRELSHWKWRDGRSLSEHGFRSGARTG